MATTKRERQRANRELRQAELKKQRTRTNFKARAIKWSRIAIVVVVLFFISNLIFGGSNEPATTTSTTLIETTTTTTIAP